MADLLSKSSEYGGSRSKSEAREKSKKVLEKSCCERGGCKGARILPAPVSTSLHAPWHCHGAHGLLLQTISNTCVRDVRRRRGTGRHHCAAAAMGRQPPPLRRGGPGGAAAATAGARRQRAACACRKAPLEGGHLSTHPRFLLPAETSRRRG
jgi:hypothetical protein